MNDIDKNYRLCNDRLNYATAEGKTDAEAGGYFDIVLGNPPYGGKYSEHDKKYFLSTYRCTETKPNIQKGSLDTYVLFLEKAHGLIASSGVVNMIVNMSVVTSDSITALHSILFKTCSLIQVSNYMDRPVQIFPEAHTRTSIIRFIKDGRVCKKLLTTKMMRWDGISELSELIDKLEFVNSREYTLFGRLPKVSKNIELSILSKIFNSVNKPIGELIDDKKGHPIYYRSVMGYFIIASNTSTDSTIEKVIRIDSKIANCVGSILSSSLFWWFMQVYSDSFHLKSYELETFTVPIKNLTVPVIRKLEKVYADYLIDIEKYANIRTTGNSSYKISEFKEYKIIYSKRLIDQIDDIICPLYGLTSEETDFIKNYEQKFRLRGAD